MAAKIVNYTPEMEAKMREVYTGTNNPVELAAICQEFGKKENSVKAKLAAMGLFVSDKAKPAGSTRVKKSDLVARIVSQGVPLNEAEAEGLEKSNATALQKVLDRIVFLTPVIEEEDDE